MKNIYQEITDKIKLNEYEAIKNKFIYKGVAKLNSNEKVVYYTGNKKQYEYYYKNNILKKVLIYNCGY